MFPCIKAAFRKFDVLYVLFFSNMQHFNVNILPLLVCN